ncbi:MAG: methyl-accepting chemotaxis protein, partial [Rhodoferax sp.]|nr:methyl-accepting chemotaxis protein [Rhodoferax sp.]
QDHHPVSQLAAVRSHQPRAQPFAGTERRGGGVPKGAAARGRASSAKASPTAPAVALHRATEPTRSATKATAADGDAQWESF